MVIIEHLKANDVPLLHVAKETVRNQPLPTVIYYHGFNGEKESSLTLAYKIAEKGLRVILPDAPLHGERNGYRDEPIEHGGPTGVGKTELSKVLAEELFGDRDALIRLDMSEYMEPHSVSKLIGSPPGYVGHEEAGQLTEKVRRNPYSIILLDEIEKAHPDVQNMSLQIMEDGHLTDSHGRRVSFKDTVIIMTSNAGSGVKQVNVGFNKANKVISTFENLTNYFKPEFLNRFDAVIEFN